MNSLIRAVDRSVLFSNSIFHLFAYSFYCFRLQLIVTSLVEIDKEYRLKQQISNYVEYKYIDIICSQIKFNNKVPYVFGYYQVH